MLDFNDAPRQLTVIDTASWDARMETLRDRLKASAHDLVREVFPRARIHANEARIGDIQGAPGESLAIALAGDTAGLWTDHATGEGGDLIELWRRTQGYPEFPRAVQDLEEWLGIGSAKPRFSTRVHKVAQERKVEAAKEPKQDFSLGAPTHSWYFKSPDGALLGIERRYLLSTGDKTYRPFNAQGEMRAPDPRPLYRQPEIRTAETVVFVEGAKCAEALASIGIEATAAMGGANTLLEKTDWTPLAGKRVILWPDNDPTNDTPKSQVGQRFMERVRPILEGIGCTVSSVTIPDSAPADGWDAANAIESGFDVAAIIASAQPVEEAGDFFEFIDVEDLEKLEPVEWLVEGILPKSGFIGLYGASGGLKSFVAVDMALHIATGREWHGNKVSQGHVIYIAGEGKRGLGKRVVGWRRAKTDAGKPAFKLLPSAIAVSSAEDLDKLTRSVRRAHLKPVLIILDTLARNFGPGDENSQKDMNAFVRGIDKLIEACGCAVMVVHHTGKDDAKGERGSSAFRGALDTSIFVKRKNRTVELINEAPFGKQKDADEFQTIKLYAAPVSFDMQGVAEKTLVLMRDDNLVGEAHCETDVEADQPQRLGAVEQSVMTALERAARDGQNLGFTRLLAVVQSKSGSEVNRGSLSRAIKNLADEDLIFEVNQDGRKSWKLP